MKSKLIFASIVTVTILLGIFLLDTFSAFGFADEPESGEEPTVEELVNATKHANAYVQFLRGGLYECWRYVYDFQTEDEGLQWLKEQGYIPEILSSKSGKELQPVADRHTGQKYTPESSLYYALPESVTMQKLEDDYFSFFYYDIYELFLCIHKHIPYGQPGGSKCFNYYLAEDEDGRLYIPVVTITEDREGWFTENFWASGKITEKAENTVTVSFMPDVTNLYETATVQFRKTDGKWKIYGGNMFEGLGEPPETGDNTPIFLTLTALSVLGLCALAVTARKRKREG